MEKNGSDNVIVDHVSRLESEQKEGKGKENGE